MFPYRRRCRIRQGLFDRWYLFHPLSDEMGWSGSRWVACNPRGLPTGDVQLCNFASEQEAREYCKEAHLRVVEK